MIKVSRDYEIEEVSTENSIIIPERMIVEGTLQEMQCTHGSIYSTIIE